MSSTNNIPNVDFSFVRYANCWEDPRLLIKALTPAPGKRILSIASAGDNSLSLLSGGAQVVAGDLNPAQIACAELRKEAIREMNQEAFLAFCGITPANHRLETYHSIRPRLSENSQSYWDAHASDITDGFIHAGKFEHYFHLFRKRILPLIHRKQTVQALLMPKTEIERNHFYDTTWNNRRWQLLFRIFFGKKAMGALGRDPEFFRHVKGSVSGRLIGRAKYGLSDLDASRNPYLTYILTGTFGSALPHYLEPEHYATIQANIDNLTIRQGAIDAIAEEYGPNSFDGFNLSDIFEYLDPNQCTEVYARLLKGARPKARFAYWNMLVPRNCPDGLASQIISREDEAQLLFLKDQAIFYSRFVVEEVR